VLLLVVVLVYSILSNGVAHRRHRRHQPFRTHAYRTPFLSLTHLTHHLTHIHSPRLSTGV